MKLTIFCLDLTNKQFGRLTAARPLTRTKHGQILWECRCVCGNVAAVVAHRLTTGNTKSCGCLVRDAASQLHTTHGYARPHQVTPEYRSWQAAKRRCYDKRGIAFPYYGERGIIMCEAWRNSFEEFIKHMGKCPPGCSLDRIDNNGNYNPGNCRWASRIEQGNNKRGNHRLNFNGKSLTIAQWSRETGLSETLIRWRLKKGWLVDKLLTVPARKCIRSCK